MWYTLQDTDFYCVFFEELSISTLNDRILSHFPLVLDQRFMKRGLTFHMQNKWVHNYNSHNYTFPASLELRLPKALMTKPFGNTILTCNFNFQWAELQKWSVYNLYGQKITLNTEIIRGLRYIWHWLLLQLSRNYQSICMYQTEKRLCVDAVDWQH